MGAYYYQDPVPGRRLRQHIFRQAKSLNLLKGLPAKRSTPSDANSFAIRNEQVKNPACMQRS